MVAMVSRRWNRCLIIGVLLSFHETNTRRTGNALTKQGAIYRIMIEPFMK